MIICLFLHFFKPLVPDTDDPLNPFGSGSETLEGTIKIFAKSKFWIILHPGNIFNNLIIKIVLRFGIVRLPVPVPTCKVEKIGLSP